MTKRRAPLTLEKALVRIADVLPGGFEQMAEVTNRPAHRVRAWADPEKRERIPVPDAKLLDRACQAHGGGMPIFEHYAASLEASGALGADASGDTSGHAARCVRECGEAIAAILDGSGAEIRVQVGEAVEALYQALAGVLGREAFEGLLSAAERAHDHQTGPPRH